MGWAFGLIFVVLAAGIVAAGTFYYRNFERRYRSQVERQLSSVAELKVAELARWRKARLSDGAFFFKNRSFSSSVHRFLEKSHEPLRRAELQDWLSHQLTDSQYDRILLIDTQGVERVSFPETPEPVESHLAQAAVEALSSRQSAFLDFYRDATGRPVHLGVLVPILDEPDAGPPLGVLILRIDPAAYLYPYLQRWPTPSSTAETLLVRREGDKVVFLNELRFQKDTALTLRLSLAQEALPAAHAALGQEGIFNGIDYRGEQVVAALRTVPNSPWFMVVRMDISEVYAPLREQLRLVEALIIVLLLGAGAGLAAFWRQQRTRFYRAKYEAEVDRAKLAAIVESSGDAIIGKSLDGTITSWNTGAERLFGYPASEMIGQPVARLLPEHAQDQEADILRRIRLGERVENYETVRIAKDGRSIDVSLTISPVLDAAGTIIGASKIARDITERKRAQEALQREEALFTSLASTIPDHIYFKDRQSRFIRVNEANARLFGFHSPNEMIGKTDFELFSKEHAQQAYADEQRIMGTGEPMVGVEEKETWPDGRVTWVSTTKIPLRDAQGCINGLVGISRDITERKQVEAAMRESEERYRSLFNNATVGIYRTTPGGHIDVANPALLRMLNYASLAELQRRNLEKDGFEPGYTRAQFRERIERDGEIIGLESTWKRVDGSVVYVRESARVVRDAAAKTVYYEGVVEDITERKLADAQLREQYEILSNSHEGLMIVNLSNEITLWNRGAEEIFGWSAVKALGQRPEDLLGIEDRESVVAMRAAAERNGFWNGEIRMKDRKNHNLIIDGRITLVRDEAGRPRARLNFLADITEKKLLEEKFLHAQRLESIGMLAAGIAHDLNNVLAPIMFAEPLLRESLSAPRDLKILDTFKKCAERGAGLVRQILGFVHSTAGEVQPTQVKHIARDIVSIIEETFPKSIELQHSIPADLWLALGNATQIHQVLLNLCVNARDAMPKGGTLRITAANRRLNVKEADSIPGGRPGAWLVLEVTDTGTGIPPEVLEKIWTPFFTTKDIGKGTGLGLSTVRGIVDNHHGFVELRTQVGRGTTFRVFLPADESELPQTRRSASPFDIPDGQGELILLVDDDPGVLSIATAILEKHGYRVVSCADGVEAIVLFITRAGEISLVITDVDMPRLGGMELAKTLSQLRPDIRLLAISGLSPDETGGSAVSAAIKATHAFLLKPFDEKCLLGAVHRLIHPSEKT
jgi:PAS domain S-box-containing protein